MLVLNCSNDATKFFSQKKKGKLESMVEKAPSNNPALDEMDLTRESFSQWFVHAFRFDRKQCLIAMEFDTRYALVFFGVKKSQMHEFEDMLVTRLIEGVYRYIEQAGLAKYITKDELYEQFIYTHGETKFFKRSDRSVVSHIKDAIVCYTTEAQYYHLPLNELDAIYYDNKINQTLRSTKLTQKKSPSDPYFEPHLEMMKKILLELSEVGEDKIQQAIDELVRSRRVAFQEKYALSDTVTEGNDNRIVSLDDFRARKRSES